MLNVSYFADTVLYIPLETNEDCLMGEIGQICVSDSILFVAERYSKLLQFDINGKFIRQIMMIILLPDFQHSWIRCSWNLGIIFSLHPCYLRNK